MVGGVANEYETPLRDAGPPQTFISPLRETNGIKNDNCPQVMANLLIDLTSPIWRVGSPDTQV